MSALRTLALVLALVAVGCAGDDDAQSAQDSRTGDDLRGEWAPSGDGGTYLVVEAEGAGPCAEVWVDGRAWSRELDVARPVAPGTREIACGEGGGRMRITVPEGTTYRLAYWGP